MVSAFPSLLSWTLVSPFLIRLTLGFVLVHWAWRALKATTNPAGVKAVGLIEAAAGILIILGLFTQVAALVTVIDLLVKLFRKIRSRAFLTDGINYYLILLVLAVSLMVTGAGLLAFDLPL